MTSDAIYVVPEIREESMQTASTEIHVLKNGTNRGQGGQDQLLFFTACTLLGSLIKRDLKHSGGWFLHFKNNKTNFILL